MTAELSQLFRRKRDGVTFVLDAVASAFPAADLRVYATRGEFLTLDAARGEPLAVAASNWAALARAVARFSPNAIVIDVGSTTTDVLPVVDGSLRALGWTDAERLRTSELIYLGAVRTPVEAIIQSVPLGGGQAGVSAEAFALTADVHIWRGALPASAYTAPTPDGRSTSREAVGERLARIVCADREVLDDASIDQIADAVAEAQIARTTSAVVRVRARHPEVATAVVTGVGEFVASAAARRAGLSVVSLADEMGPAAACGAPAAAVGLLLSELLNGTPYG
jgi:probable H4MPT-linked C1 transfer pathway protein